CSMAVLQLAPATPPTPACKFLVHATQGVRAKKPSRRFTRLRSGEFGAQWPLALPFVIFAQASLVFLQLSFNFHERFLAGTAGTSSAARGMQRPGGQREI